MTTLIIIGKYNTITKPFKNIVLTLTFYVILRNDEIILQKNQVTFEHSKICYINYIDKQRIRCYPVILNSSWIKQQYFLYGHNVSIIKDFLPSTVTIKIVHLSVESFVPFQK